MDQNHLINLIFFLFFGQDIIFKNTKKRQVDKRKNGKLEKGKERKGYSSKTRQTFFVTTYVLHFNSNLQ